MLVLRKGLILRQWCGRNSSVGTVLVPHKLEDPSSNPPNLHKSLLYSVSVCIPSAPLGRWVAERGEFLETDQLSCHA